MVEATSFQSEVPGLEGHYLNSQIRSFIDGPVMAAARMIRIYAAEGTFSKVNTPYHESKSENRRKPAAIPTKWFLRSGTKQELHCNY